MKVSRRRGQVRLALDRVEAAVLAGLFDELAAAVAGDALNQDDPVSRRLFPSAYPDDPAADAEFRSLTEATLRDERSERARVCAEQLRRSVTDLTLDADDGTRWIQTLNDLRLALGTRLDITEDDTEPDPDAPDYQERAVYYWLTALQDSLVRALMA